MQESTRVSKLYWQELWGWFLPTLSLMGTKLLLMHMSSLLPTSISPMASLSSLTAIQPSKIDDTPVTIFSLAN
jgi:hypothetical protein